MKTFMTALVAAVVGSVSATFATEPFDVNIYQPVYQGNELTAHAQMSPRPERRRAPLTVQPFTAGEKALFDRIRPE